MVSTTDFDSVGIGSIPIIAVSFFFKSPGCGGSIPPRGVPSQTKSRTVQMQETGYAVLGMELNKVGNKLLSRWRNM